MDGNKIRNWFETAFLEVKWFFQRLFRGYSDYDLIDYGEFACQKLLPSLKAWVAHERHGYPSSFKDMEEWNEVLGKILWAVEETATNKHEHDLYENWEKDGLTEDERREHIQSIWDRTEEGMKLLGEYLPAMWD